MSESKGLVGLKYLAQTSLKSQSKEWLKVLNSKSILLPLPTSVPPASLCFPSSSSSRHPDSSFAINSF
jgi:hypothetical protein